MFTFIHYTLHKFTISSLHEMTEFRVPVHNVVLSQHWPPLTRKDIHKYNYTKKNSVCRCAMLCSHNIDHFWHGESAKMSPSTVTHCYSEYSLLGTSYSEFHSLPDIYFPYTGLYPAQGQRGKRPELESQLTSRPPAPKRPRSLGFFLQHGLTGPWPLFQGTGVISLGLGSPLTYIFYHDMQISWPDSGSPPIRLSDS